MVLNGLGLNDFQGAGWKKKIAFYLKKLKIKMFLECVCMRYVCVPFFFFWCVCVCVFLMLLRVHSSDTAGDRAYIIRGMK